MAFDIAYASRAAYKLDEMRNQASTAYDAAIDRDLLAISRVIDRKLGRSFGKSDTVEERFFYPNRQNYGPRVYGMRPVGWAESENPWRWAGAMRMLIVDDIATLTGLAVRIDEDGDGVFTNDTDLDLTQLEMQPLNASAFGEPYRAITIPDWSTIGGFNMNKKVRVTATYGWEAVPEAIVRATIDLTGILRLDSPRALRTVTEVNQVLGTSAKAQSILNDLLQTYSRKAGLFNI